MRDYRELRERCIELMGEADFKRLMDQFNRSSSRERTKIEAFLTEILEDLEGEGGEERGALLGKTQKLSKKEIEKVRQWSRDRRYSKPDG
jgi:hypothetical protein